MKKIFAVWFLGIALSLGLVGCSFTEQKSLSNVGIPSHVKYIGFNNGGTFIAEATDAEVEILVQSNKTILSVTENTNKIQFYVYKITGNVKVKDIYGEIRELKEIEIIDSEALAITIKEY